MKIQNEQAIVEFISYGAQISSFKKIGDDYEYMWQGDQKFWSGRNPTLFPMVGSTFNDGSYVIAGKKYVMKNHGLVRYMNFNLLEESENSIEFNVCFNEETLKRYPFKFEFSVLYALDGKRLNISYKIKNIDDKEMPFTFGLHPAFNTFDGFDTCKILFEKPEKNLTKIFTDKRVEVDEISELVVTRAELNAIDTIIFEGFESKYVDLTDGKKIVRVGIEGYKYLAFWSKDGAPFICIEPWYGINEFTDTGLDFKDLEGMMSLASNEVFECCYFIELI